MADTVAVNCDHGSQTTSIYFYIPFHNRDRSTHVYFGPKIHTVAHGKQKIAQTLAFSFSTNFHLLYWAVRCRGFHFNILYYKGKRYGYKIFSLLRDYNRWQSSLKITPRPVNDVKIYFSILLFFLFLQHCNFCKYSCLQCYVHHSWYNIRNEFICNHTASKARRWISNEVKIEHQWGVC